MHSASAFVTLTYSDLCLPKDGSLSKRTLQLFMKRLRKERMAGLRFFGCGEYGEMTARPHYHLLLFNTDFADKVVYSRVSDGPTLYVSEELSRLWPFGENKIGEVNAQTCAYVSQYVMKKAGSSARSYGSREEEFRVMSRRPGIGYTWFEKYHGEAYAHDSAIVDGKEVPLPRYYDTKFESIDSARLVLLKRNRRKKALLLKSDNTLERRRVRERHLFLLQARFKREFR